MKEAMRRNWRRFLLPAVVLLLCLVWSGTALAESTVELHYGGILDYTKANQVAELVNQQRTANGKSKLTQTGDLQQMAMIGPWRLPCIIPIPGRTAIEALISWRPARPGRKI